MPFRELISAYSKNQKLTNYLTDSMKQRTSEANSFSGTQGIPHILWKVKVYYRVHNSSPHVPARSTPYYFWKSFLILYSKNCYETVTL
jgi:hypothetical protein